VVISGYEWAGNRTVRFARLEAGRRFTLSDLSDCWEADYHAIHDFHDMEYNPSCIGLDYRQQDLHAAF